MDPNPDLCGRRNWKVRMVNDEARKRLVEMMFEGLLKQRFSQFARKYGRGPVVQTWASIVKRGGIKAYLWNREWDSNTKIIDALDCLDCYCDWVEARIQDTIKKRLGRSESTGQNYSYATKWQENYNLA